MEAFVTLKLKVSELDTLRRALGFYADQKHDVTRMPEADAKTRHDAAQESVLANDLLGKLNSQMFTVRVVTGGEKAVSVRDSNFETKRMAFEFIGKFGELSMIKKMGRLYIIQPKKK